MTAATAILTTKLYVPPPPPKVVPRTRLIARLDEAVQRRLTLVSAPAGFGKTTLLSAWIAASGRRVAWLSLDAGDSDPPRFVTYLVAALRTVSPHAGDGVAAALLSPQPPPPELIMTALVNEIAAIEESFVLVLDDYHAIEAAAVDNLVAFLIEHMPPQMRLIISTREDPQFPLARLRAQDRLAEIRAQDLRFSAAEAAAFLRGAMGLSLSEEEVAALEARTEGWIAGLQLAAISLQSQGDNAGFIKSFTGSHRFVMDFLLEEVLQRQPEQIQRFLLYTSILERMCAPLCDALLLDPSASSRQTLEYLERANLFTIPLDGERRWYRYHHLFADLLRQRLQQTIAATGEDPHAALAGLHTRAARWYEENNLEIEAFFHAVAANDVEHAERLIEGKGTPLHLRGLVNSILDWLGSLPGAVKDARPSLWVKYGSLMLVVGRTTGVEEALAAGEVALQGREVEGRTRTLLGQIAAARATLALTRYDAVTMIAQSSRALEYLPPGSRSMRANAHWTLGFARMLQGERAEARRAIMEAIAISGAAGDTFTTILATVSLGVIQEMDNELHQAANTHRKVLQMAGEQPLQIIYEAHLGLARVLYEWNELEAAEEHGHQALYLARQYEKVIDRFILCELFLARVRAARGDRAGAAAMLAQTAQSARERNFLHRIPDVAAAQVPILLLLGKTGEAAHLAQTLDLPLSKARVYLAGEDVAAAISVLEQYLAHVEARGWKDETLKTLLLLAIGLGAQGDLDGATHRLGEALAMAEPGGFVRIFLDEGRPVARLLSAAAERGMMPDYSGRLLSLFRAKQAESTGRAPGQPLAEPLTTRELEVLRLIAQGLTNQEIGDHLFLALDTVKGHNRRIFDKLRVERRTEAIARARDMGLL